jgi:hypothetical protein
VRPLKDRSKVCRACGGVAGVRVRGNGRWRDACVRVRSRPPPSQRVPTGRRAARARHTPRQHTPAATPALLLAAARSACCPTASARAGCC